MSTDQDYVAPSIIPMEVDNDDADESYYRVRIGNRVKYLEIAPATLERGALSFPLAFLPPLPFDGDWSVAHISRDGTPGELKTSLSHRQLAAVHNLSGAVFEALLPDAAFPGIAPHQPSDRITVIAKIARFEWEISDIERETRAYQVLVQK
ncbi:alpha-galactosidase A [Botryosphaeria dothidea]|uniref:Alpha-galactosidase A n=1 Tax=Botryosphaeria dothidea TaxID=55169 RepID=A0A8H4IP85_9PEZI|nr:alpha-galactosidase A [Botryosphaeria dothidea]